MAGPASLFEWRYKRLHRGVGQVQDLSDFFYIWLRKALIEVHPALFGPKQVQRADELIVTKSLAGVVKDSAYFESGIRAVAEGLRSVAKPTSLVVIVFANPQTAAWEALLSAVVEAGLVVSASWPIDTERAARTRAQKAASLQSSVHLVCRPRENADGSQQRDNIGDWRDVLAKLPRRMHEWMPRLRQEGVVGADAIFAWAPLLRSIHAICESRSPTVSRSR